MPSNHVHLLMKDTGGDVMPRTFIYSPGGRRKNAIGARTAMARSGRAGITLRHPGRDDHLHQVRYVYRLKMVRAGVVSIRANGSTAVSRDFTSRVAAILYVCCPLLVSIESSGFLKLDLQGLMHEPSKNLLIF